MAKRSLLPALGCLLALAGCQSGTLPNPNDPKDVGVLSAEVVASDLQSVSANLWERVAKREITDAEARQYLKRRAEELISAIPMDRIDPDGVKEYAELYRIAQRWPEARKLLEVAVKEAETVDERVNCSLRLAMVMASMGEVGIGIKTARSVFDVAPEEKAPILPSILYEFVPAARGKKENREVARLLDDAITQHLEVVVDPSTDQGKAFLQARYTHIAKAWVAIVELLREGGYPDEAAAAERDGERMLRSAQERRTFSR